MFGFIGGFPRRVKHLLSKLKKHFTKPQYDNFCRVTMGLMTAGKKEHDVKSMNELFIDRKDQSSLNRFITESNWNAQEVAKAGQTVLLCEAELNPTVEHKVVDDTVCRKYSPKTEMACYNHSSTMGTVLSHDYVTALSVNNDVAFGDGLKLYGSKKKCGEKGVTFKTRLELACELIDEHKPMADSTIMLWDSWYMCQKMVERCESHGYGWMGETKSNRVAFYEKRKYHLAELLDNLREEGRFVDVLVDGEVYNACQLEVFVPKLGLVRFVVDVKADTKDVHLLCTNLTGCSLEELVGHALVMCRINKFHKEAKFLGFGEYRFRASEAALTHAHLVVLAYTLLDALRRRLLRYHVVKSLLSIEATVEWIRRKSVHLLMRKVKESILPMRSILRMINTN